MPALDDPIAAIKGVGEVRARMLKRLNIATVGDALRFLPREYRDLSSPTPLAAARHGEEAVVVAQVAAKGQVSQVRPGMALFKLSILDDGIPGNCLWYNQPFLQGVFKPGEKYIFFGRVERRFGEIQLTSPQYEPYIVGAGKKVLPLYPTTQGLSQKVLRGVIYNALQYAGPVEDTMPQRLRVLWGLMGLRQALEDAHFPPSLAQAQLARDRLAFEELLLFVLFLRGQGLQRRERGQGHAFACAEDAALRWEQRLPFPLTGAQKRVMGEITAAMRSPTPMNRLVQGDVGCGKTVLALEALYFCALDGMQGALMAPTELLAEQHYAEARKYLEPLGVRVGKLVGSMAEAEKKELRKRISKGEIDVAVGTHALIQKGMQYHALGLVITDEQHRFGVAQRARLAAKGRCPDALVMSATPVPRTLALLIYADLDLSIVDELPPGRKPVLTRMVPTQRQEDMYRFVRRMIEEENAQAYIVCPRIEETDSSTISAAQSVYDTLRGGVFKGIPMALLHGRQSAMEKDGQVEAFRRGDVKAMVSTTVIEVGMNVPKASVMVVEDAERFGLAQLHQLRGRVGRGSAQAWCFLVSTAQGDAALRLKTLCQTNDGFKVAEADLQARGPGEFMGTRQAGSMDLHMLRLMGDTRFFQRVSQACDMLLGDETFYAERDALLSLGKQRFLHRLEDIAFN